MQMCSLFQRNNKAWQVRNLRWLLQKWVCLQIQSWWLDSYTNWYILNGLQQVLGSSREGLGHEVVRMHNDSKCLWCPFFPNLPADLVFFLKKIIIEKFSINDANNVTFIRAFKMPIILSTNNLLAYIGPVWKVMGTFPCQDPFYQFCVWLLQVLGCTSRCALIIKLNVLHKYLPLLDHITSY